MAALSERSERPSRGDREHAGERRFAGRDGSSIRRRVCHHDQHCVELGVAELERDASELALGVVDPRLYLDGQTATAAVFIKEVVDEHVPSSPITGDGERDLESNRDLRRQARSEPVDHPELPGIAERIPVRVGPDTDIEPHHRAEACQLDNGGGWGKPSLDPADLWCGESHRLGDTPKGQPSSHASRANVGSHPGDVGARHHRSPVDRTFAGRHRHSLTREAQPQLNPGFAPAAPIVGGSAGARQLLDFRCVGRNMRRTIASP
jgi:hypothetical protein